MPLQKIIIFIAIALVCTRGEAQKAAEPKPLLHACAEIKAPQLYGEWIIDTPAGGPQGKMTMRQHPEFSDSLRTERKAGGGRTTIIASGDVEEGEFNLDESNDGVRLTATWSGHLVEGACSREIRGQWEDLLTGAKTSFVLRRRAGW